MQYELGDSIDHTRCACPAAGASAKQTQLGSRLDEPRSARAARPGRQPRPPADTCPAPPRRQNPSQAWGGCEPRRRRPAMQGTPASRRAAPPHSALCRCVSAPHRLARARWLAHAARRPHCVAPYRCSGASRATSARCAARPRARSPRAARAARAADVACPCPRAGTFGRVLECWDRETQEFVAVKVIRNVKKYHQAAMIEARRSDDPHRVASAADIGTCDAMRPRWRGKRIMPALRCPPPR